MNTVQIERKSYEMPPRDGFTVAHFLTVADIDVEHLLSHCSGTPMLALASGSRHCA